MADCNKIAKTHSLEELADSIATLVTDYRADEGVCLTSERVQQWVQQFDREDRYMLLTETEAILKKRYFSKADALKFLHKALNRFAQDFAGGDIKQLLRETVFLNLQAPDKSQSAMISLLDEITVAHGLQAARCGGEAPKQYVYLDDVLCTGNTVFLELKSWWEELDTDGNPRYKTLEKDVKVHHVFIAVHVKGWTNVVFRFKKAHIPRAMPTTVWRGVEIQNNPDVSEAALDFAWPRYKGLPSEANTYLQQLGVEAKSVCRPEGKPKQEKLFTSPAARDHFERVALLKGIELLTSVANKKENIRPLGFTLPSHKTLGFGSLVFTWRNVPNNSPLIFWYNAPGFTPLFEKRPSFSAFFG